MHKKGEARLGDGGKRGLQLLLVDHGKAIAAGVDEEALETEDARTCERENVLLIVCDYSAPRGPVDEAFALRRRAFFFERSDRGGLGQAV